MQRRTFGWTGVQVPVIGQGTWKMEGDSPAEALAALQAGLDAGMTHVDTAELYGGGRVESLVARAIAGRRDEVFLVSKVMPNHASRSGTVQACEASLRRLGTDHLDCYLLHWPGQHPLEDTIAAFEQLVRDGKIRSWGLSNFDVDDLEEALAIAGPRRIACNQVLYHLRARDIEGRVLPWCVEHEVAVVGYSPFGSGDFPAAAVAWGQGARRGGPGTRGDRAPGGAGLPRPRSARLRHPQVGEGRAGQGERRRGGAPAGPGRGRAHRRGVPRSEGSGAPHALTGGPGSLTSHRLNAPTGRASKRRPGSSRDGSGPASGEPRSEVRDGDLRTRADGYDSVLYVERVEAGSRTEASWTQMLGGDAAYNTAEHLYASFETSLVDLESEASEQSWIPLQTARRMRWREDSCSRSVRHCGGEGARDEVRREERRCATGSGARGGAVRPDRPPGDFGRGSLRSERRRAQRRRGQDEHGRGAIPGRPSRSRALTGTFVAATAR